MIKQNDLALRKEIQLYGCNFLCHLAMVRKDWTSREVEDLYQRALDSQIISKNCSVHKPDALLGLATSSLKQIGGLVLASQESWGVLEVHPRVQYKIARWRARDSVHQHFTLFNLQGEIYDPFDARIPSYPLEKIENIGYQLYG